MGEMYARGMALLPRLVILVPLVLSIIGMVLSALALFAGNQKGFMEEYAIARLNVSMMGHDLLSKGGDDKKEDKRDDDDDDNGEWFSKLLDNVGEVGNDLVGDAVDDVADALGISDWYSIHVMNACEGNFKSNGNASSSSLNTTNCTEASAGYRFNLTELLDKEMSVGPLDVNLNKLGWTDDIQKELNTINNMLMGLFILYVLGMGLSSVSILGSASAAVLPQTFREVSLADRVSLANLVVAALAAASLTGASIVVTVAVTVGIDGINKAGEKVGINVSRGTAFIAISWVATAVMVSATVFWGVQFWMEKRKARALHSEKTGDGQTL
ncbi:hypothetical protein ACO1O0_004222 [Amphichorda felina]